MRKRLSYEESRKREKVEVIETIFHEVKEQPFKWKDIKHLNLQDEDVLNIRYEEGFYSENNSWDGGFVAEVERPRLETDEEFNERMEKLEKDRAEMKERRRQNYLKLKEEFEPNSQTKNKHYEVDSHKTPVTWSS